MTTPPFNQRTEAPPGSYSREAIKHKTINGAVLYPRQFCILADTHSMIPRRVKPSRQTPWQSQPRRQLHSLRQTRLNVEYDRRSRIG